MLFYKMVKNYITLIDRKKLVNFVIVEQLESIFSMHIFPRMESCEVSTTQIQELGQ